MKKLLSILSSILIVATFVVSTTSMAFNFPISSTLTSESVLVINLDSDITIHEKNIDMQQMPGPLVNIMTAIICLENSDNLKEQITIDSSIYSELDQIEYYQDLRYADIYNGDVLTVEDLLYAMMLTSSIEASQTLAYHFGDKSVSTFVSMMNDKAKELGCTGTNFTNPTGMYDLEQYTTARDLAIITQYALTIPHFSAISTAQTYIPSVLNPENHPSPSEWQWSHSNLMVFEDDSYYYNGAKGIKTANLTAYGRNLITLGSKDGNNYLVILLKSPMKDADGNGQFYHLKDATNILNWAFNDFTYQVLLSENTEITELEVALGENSDYVLLKPSKEFSYLWYDGIDVSLIRRELECDTNIQAPIYQNEKLGTLTLKYSGEYIGSVDLVAASDIERSFMKYNIYAAKNFISSKWFDKALIVSCILCGLYILLCIYAFICFKNKSKPIQPIYTMPKFDETKKKKRKK